MANTTEKLELHLPDYTDEIYETIEQLGQNFAKLDEVSPDYGTAPPVAGTWQQRHIVWNAEPAIGGYAGWVNTRTGRTAPSWTELTSYKTGDYIIPKTDNAHVYICIQAGHSGAMEPVFPTASGQEVQDTRGAQRWQRSKRYEKHDIVFPTVDNGRFYVCITAGESGGTEPEWALTDGTSIYDGAAVWLGYRIAKWKESGISALFRPFGKIE